MMHGPTNIKWYIYHGENLVVKYTTSEIRKCSFCRLLSEITDILYYWKYNKAGDVCIT